MQKISGLEVFPTLADYDRLSDDDLAERIETHKKSMGQDLIILGHHYQRPRITKLSDFVGDSFGLSEKASKAPGQNIVFCGVRFMAESAAILCNPSQKVFHPDPEAGCPMADMANMVQVSKAWRTINGWIGTEATGAHPEARGRKQGIIPVTYMNSTADLKAFCGENGGIVCTSSNAGKVYDWAFERGEKIFFFPDQHLGRNTGLKKDIPAEKMVLWNPWEEDGGLTAEEVRDAKLILWNGHCPVHSEFKARDVQHVRKFYPGCKVVVHPECDRSVVGLADAVGSTEYIVKYVAEQPPKSVIFVGTEVNLVNRLQEMHPDKRVFKLQRSLCLTMYQINLSNLCYTLEHLEELETVELPEIVKANAKIALDRMLALK
jgi:quinolinate synthase